MATFASVLCAICLLVVVECYHISTFPRNIKITSHQFQLKSSLSLQYQPYNQGLHMSFLAFGNGRVDKNVPVCSFLTSTQKTLKDLSNRVQKHVFLTLFFIASALYAFLSRAAVAHAKSASSKGWGLYGRIPYDDWLFTTDKLIDPNLLRKSLIEAISIELPVAVDAASRREGIRFLGAGIKGFIIIGIPVCLLATAFAPTIIKNFNARRKKLNASRGMQTTVTAKYKNQPEKEKPVYMDGLVVDMSAWRFKKDDKPAKKEDDKEKDKDNSKEEETDEEKKKKKSSDDEDDDDDGKWNWDDDDDE